MGIHFRTRLNPLLFQLLFCYIIMAWLDADNKTCGYARGENVKLDDDDMVAHVVGSSKDTNNWKKYWMEHTGRAWPRTCQIYGCGKPADVGAHVYIKGMKGNKWYFILPTCQGCNTDKNSDYGRGDAWCSAKQDAVTVASLAKDCCFD
eukprot:GDKH01025915.1.p1 GENE.GDKH01025915.1~~GDKH01025915.1.p1  ORF type:complete len:148 (-),score=16.94 GDKH01025915.1:102-545(-)